MVAPTAAVGKGNRLGVLTYSHKKPNKSTADEFIDDIARNEQTVSPFKQTAQGQPKYFRFPRMKVSLDTEARAKIDRYLRDNGYTIAPATIDAHDETFNWIYCSAMSRKDEDCVNLLKVYFKSLLLDTTLKARESARQLAGHDVKHILVVKADQLTCDFLGEMIAWNVSWMNDEGCSHVTPEERYRRVLRYVQVRIRENPHYASVEG